MSTPSLFRSFFLGGFECSSHRPRSRRRLDLIAATEHDRHAADDYARLRARGLRAARDGLRWHRIEYAPGRYDFSSVLPMVRAARDADLDVVWDLCHYGWPDDLDVWSAAFVERFAGLARAFATVLASESDRVPFLAPINEISFFAWAGGEVAYFNPFDEGRGDELKAQLVRAAIAGIEAIWDVRPGARIVHTDPVIHVAADPTRPGERADAEAYRLAQYQAWDMLAGRRRPGLGGRKQYLDILGVNYYPHNQWVHGAPAFNPEAALPRSHPLYRPFRSILSEVHARYGRPILVAETGADGSQRDAWLRYVGGEVRAAMRAGVSIEGVCLYPIVSFPWWDDDVPLLNGLWGFPDAAGERTIYQPLAQELRRQVRLVDRLRVRRDGGRL